ncbi:MAG: hypothetical protein Fur0041_06520 [Bacteroidia bacterium]
MKQNVSLFRKIRSWLIPVRIEQKTGELGHTVEVNLYKGKFMLDSEHANYSFGALESVFHHAFTVQGIYKENLKHVLILGFGSGCTASLLAVHNNPEIYFTGVEADKVVIALFHQYFRSSAPRHLELIHQDAAEFLKSCKQQYDLILVDTFIDQQVPQHVTDETFISDIRQALTLNGKVLFNFIAQRTFDNEVAVLEKKFMNVFGNVTPTHSSIEGITNVVFCAQKKS